MRLVRGVEAGPEPIDRMQQRVPDERISGPVRHHARHVKNAGKEIEKAGDLRPDLVPGPVAYREHRIDKADAATEHRRGEKRPIEGIHRSSGAASRPMKPKPASRMTATITSVIISNRPRAAMT